MRGKGLALTMSLFICFVIVAIYGISNNEHKEQRDWVVDPEVTASGNILKNNGTIIVEVVNQSNEKIGTAQLQQQTNGVRIKLDASRLPPGKHGFHIHENGRCDVPSFETAGSHFNPTGASHGSGHQGGPHAGDLPNLEVAADGTVHIDYMAKMVTFEKGEYNSLFKQGGTSLIIHSKADDYKSQPAGDAGERIACGIISK